MEKQAGIAVLAGVAMVLLMLTFVLSLRFSVSAQASPDESPTVSYEVVDRSDVPADLGESNSAPGFSLDDVRKAFYY